MKYSIKRFFAGVSLIFLSITQSLGGGTSVGNVHYPSDNKLGAIGVTEEAVADNPADNIFHVNIQEQLNPTDKVWLVYELAGVEDHTCISRSINDQLAVGGHWVSKKAGYSEQRERISQNWLQQGDNVIRFTVPYVAEHGYKVRNLRIEVEKNVLATTKELVVNQPEFGGFYGDVAYLKGYVRGEIEQLFVGGIPVTTHNGEFEATVKQDKPRKKATVLVEAVFKNGESLSQEILFTQPQYPDYTYAIAAGQQGVQKTFIKTEETSLTLQNATVIAPAGALVATTGISITSLRDVDIPALDPGMVNVTAGGEGYRFLPHRSAFEKDLTVKLGFDPTKMPDGYTAKDIRTYYFDEETHHWLPLQYDTVDTEQGIVVSRTNHFTDMINSIIKVPESPEASAYNPTSMKGIKAANPTAAINLMNPPSANNMGTANTGYPINVPPGRNGMQPQLAISYNSGGGNDWLGLGWNLQCPSIMIETRWGVPRYDAGKETETYLLNGEQLVPLNGAGTQLEPMPHRDNSVNRIANRRFHTRIEGGFDRVERKGNNPGNYWWIVTDKSGTRYFYGGTPESGQDDDAVLKDDNGNVAKWCLSEVRDLNGNFIKYHYTIVNDKGNASGSIPGRQIYCDKITYTGHNGSEGPYEVNYIRDKELGESARPDKTINGRYGFKEVTGDLLRKIEVKFNNNLVRRYELEYIEGAFNKTLLHKIKEFDAAGNFFNEHEFSYFDDVRDGNNYKPFEDTEEDWNLGDDNIKRDMLTEELGFDGKATAINGTKSENGGFGMAITVGPQDGNPVCKSLTVGGQFGFSVGFSNGMLMLIDLNGDGLPDKVMVEDGKVYYRPNTSGPDAAPGAATFGTKEEIVGINDIMNESNSTWSAGVQGNGPGCVVSPFVGLNVSHTTSKTKIFFTDANGDQLPDIVVNKTVWFNRLNSQGVPYFEPSSTGTPSPINESGQIDPGLFEIDQDAFEEAVDANPLHDIVRMWQAPYDGTVNINAPVNLVDLTADTDYNPDVVDGVRVAVQHKGNELWFRDIQAGDFTTYIPVGDVTALEVEKGDRVYFRVQSKFNGEFDKVNWNPQINYLNVDTDITDADGRKIFSYKASEDFLLSMPTNVGPPVDGEVKFQGTFTKPVTSDDIHVVIKEEISGAVVFERFYDWDEVVNESYDLPFDVVAGEVYSFKATSTTHIDWSAIIWDNYVYYTATDDPNIHPFDKDGNPLIEFYPAPDFSVYAEPFNRITGTWRAPEDGDITVFPLLEFNTGDAAGEITLSVKKKQTTGPASLVAKKTLTIVDSEVDITAQDSTIMLPVAYLDNYYIEYHTDDEALLETISALNVRVKFERTEAVTFPIPADENDPLTETIDWDAPDNGTAYITPLLAFAAPQDGQVKITATRTDETVEEQVFTYNTGTLDVTDTLEVTTDSIEAFTLQYTTVGLMGDMVNPADITTPAELQVYFVSIDDFEAATHQLVEDVTFGPFFRQWGHFAYNGNRERANEVINESELHLDDGYEEGAEAELTTPASSDPEAAAGELGSEAESENVYDPAEAKFILLIPDAENDRWLGQDNLVYLVGDAMSSSRMGLDDLTQENPLPGSGGSGLRAITKISKNTTTAVSLGAAAGPISGSLSKSFGTTRVTADYIDMNGDRHPDVLTENKIQYSNPFGGMSDNKHTHNFGNNHEAKTDATGVTLGGGFVVARFENKTGNQKSGDQKVGSGSSSVGLSGSLSYAEGHDQTEHTWSDINGDGLPDFVFIDNNNLYVRLNIGYSFLAPEKWDVGWIGSADSKSFNGGGGLGVNLGNKSISAGIGLSRSDNEPERALQDLNGDGLSDLVLDNGGNLSVAINTGNGFAAPITWTGASDIAASSSVSESVNAAFTICLPPPIPVKVCFNPSFDAGRGASKTQQQISDVDGDGYPDYITSDEDNNLTVKRSTIGRTNMLKEIKRPLGATITLDYERVGNTYEMPNDVWTLKTVEVYDGFDGDGVDNLKNEFVYEDGFFDRHEREFYGFKKVITRTLDTDNSDALYRVSAQTFENGNYYEKGLTLEETTADADGNLFIKKEYSYTPQDVLSGNSLLPAALESTNLSIFPAMTETKSFFYEGQQQPGKSTRMTYGYDVLGNVVEYADFGDQTAADNLFATITYHSYPANYIVGMPASITVEGDRTYRERSSVIDPNTGNVTEIKQFLDNGDAAVYNMEYDDFGNLEKITRPENHNGDRFEMAYEYDPQVNTYVVKTSNSYGYESSADYDLKFGQLIESTDINGQKITYELDDLGRITEITGPYEQQGNGYTLQFEYHPFGSDVPWALTRHFDPQYPTDPLETAIFVDGLGRVLQTKKDGSIFTGEGAQDDEVMIVSGRVLFDAFGRTTAAFYPTAEPTGNPGTFNPAFDDQAPTTTEYDVLDRALQVTLPDGATTFTAYDFANDRDGVQQFSTLVTDANGVKTEQFTDVRGRVTATLNYTSFGNVWTSFQYNAINELIASTDDQGHTTTHEYDNFGRKIKRVHPDAGETTYEYDLSSNLVSVQTANLKETGGLIEYAYDFERLISINYPEFTDNNVTYTYGDAGDPHNRAGRVVIQEDASGAQEFFYGPLGEVEKNIRTIVIPGHDELTFTTEWEYDTWNRINKMIYPDGEEVTYTYNKGGLLKSMAGDKNGTPFQYINRLGYDEFEQRTFLEYGNGTKTTYEYEPERRRLHNMNAQTSSQRTFMDNEYTYDKTSNILSMENKAPVPTSNLMGGSSNYTFEYDDLYRLTKAEGTYQGSNHEHRYTLDMQYNSVGGITGKNQVHERAASGGQNPPGGGQAWVTQNKTTYQLDYQYGQSQPHAPVHIGEKSYSYDANGNQTGWEHDVSGQRREIVWDEENRMRALSDNGATSFYVYDAQNIRVLKGHASKQHVYVNGKPAGGGGGVGNYTVYVNPYLVLRSGSYTKHFFIESQRIVSKLGDTENLGRTTSRAGEGKVNYGQKKGKAHEGLVKNIKFLGADSTFLTAGKSGKVPPGQINNNGNGNGNNSTVGEKFQFFYHPDHVGSTSYITDASGEVYQHLEYFPFGETFVEEHSNTNRTPYLFNGKELDEETGLYYYGSRYYEPNISIWQSVDNYADKYPGLSPYSFVANNPILLTDPTGDTLTLSGSESALNKFKNVVNEGLGGFYNLNISKDGQASLESTGMAGPMSNEQKALYETLSKAIDPSQSNIEIGLLEHSDLQSHATIVGGYATQEIDVDDVLAFNKVKEIVSPQAKLGHELAEQIEKQRYGTSYREAHSGAAMMAEEAISGSIRMDVYSVAPTSKTYLDGSVGKWGVFSGNVDIRYKNNGKIVTIRYNLIKGNIKSTEKIK